MNLNNQSLFIYVTVHYSFSSTCSNQFKYSPICQFDFHLISRFFKIINQFLLIWFFQIFTMINSLLLMPRIIDAYIFQNIPLACTENFSKLHLPRSFVIPLSCLNTPNVFLKYFLRGIDEPLRFGAILGFCYILPTSVGFDTSTGSKKTNIISDKYSFQH